MKHISNIVNMDKVSKMDNGHMDTSPDCPLTATLIDQLFGFFYALCRGFEKQYQDPKRLNVEKTQWRAAFQDLGINERSQIEWGIKRTRLESPINTPTIKQFLEWCTPTAQQLGLPSFDQAFDEACKNSHPTATKVWTHDVVYYAWAKTGSYDLRQQSSATIRPKFEEYYKEAIKLHAQGKILRQIENNPPPTPARRMDGKPMKPEQALAEMRRKLGMSKRD